MKKINYYAEATSEINTIYFDFSNDFPALGINYLCTTSGDPITDNDMDGDEIERIEAMIQGNPSEDATERDMDYVRELVGVWGL